MAETKSTESMVFLIDKYNTWKLLSNQTLVAEMMAVVLKKLEFDYLNLSKLTLFFQSLDLSRFLPKK